MTPVRRGSRILAALLDHIAMTVIAAACSIPYILASSISSVSSGSNMDSASLFSVGDILGSYWPLGLIGIAVYLCKDSIGGRSVAKRVFKWQVVNVQTAQTAHPIRCMFRNLFILLWPVELIVLLITPSRRIGDYVVGTKVQASPDSQAKANLNLLGALQAFGIAYLILVVATWCVVRLA